MGRFKLTGNLRPYPDPVHQMAPSLLRRSSGNQTGVEAELPLMHREPGGQVGKSRQNHDEGNEEDSEESPTGATDDNLTPWRSVYQTEVEAELPPCRLHDSVRS